MQSFMKWKPRDHDGDEKRDLIHSVELRAREWYKVYFLELILRQKPLPPSKDGRHISLLPVHLEPLIDERTGRRYVSNKIRSSRYTIIDFLPKQFIFQATRLSNFYFICIGIPQAIPGLSTTGSYTTILPLLFFICLIIAKEGYDDLRRHRLDKVENRQLAQVLKQGAPFSLEDASWLPSISKSWSWNRKWPLTETEDDSSTDMADSGLHWAKTMWQDIRVGDIIRLERNDAIPADIVLLYSTGEHGKAYVETMALDGETTLKIRQAPDALNACETMAGIQFCEAKFVVEDPNNDLYTFRGRVSVNGEVIPLSLNEIILRGSVLRNTEYVIGMVIHSGEECKIRMNANHHPKAKKPRLEKFANQIVLTLVFYVIVVTAGCSAGYFLWQRSTGRNSWYLGEPVDMKEIIIGFAIEFNNVIPLALYVSLEVVKIGQMILTSLDVEMYDEASNTPMVCNTNTILENLGQVTHILSDKTGTLTENIMKFRKMSISGFSWILEDNENSHPGKFSGGDLMKYINAHPSHWLSKRAREFVLGLALCNTCLPERNEGNKTTFQASSPDEVALVQAAQDLGYELINRSSRLITLETNHSSNSNNNLEVYEILDTIEFSSYRKRMSIILKTPDGKIWLICKGADSVIVPRLQSSTLAERAREEIRESLEIERQHLRRSEHNTGRTSTGGRVSLNAARPSLNAGRTSLSIGRAPTALSMNSDGHGEDLRRSFKDSHDQNSSAVPIEGSETVEIAGFPMFGDAQVYTHCFRHLHEYATEGLRTLLFAHRHLQEDEYLTWKKTYQKATTALINRQEQIEAAGELIEHSFELLGASAIEDKLQKGVAETVEKLQRANISIWMLTGDKRETAMNIAHSAGICKPHSSTLILDSEKGRLQEQLQEWKDDLQDNAGHSVAVIDGNTLANIELDHALKASFYSLIPSFHSVVCCRASPAQKATIVKAIKSRVPEALTLAIGDGANDIAMIQASVSLVLGKAQLISI
jgi:phospholipid-translocating ATPase